MYTVFENEMKWYANEKIPGQLDYNVADAMLSLVQKYNIKVRGHNVFWDNPQNMPFGRVIFHQHSYPQLHQEG